MSFFLAVFLRVNLFFKTLPIAETEIISPVLEEVVSPPTRSIFYSSQAILTPL